MPIREDLVAQAAKFLQDPSVAGSPVESRVAFLQQKNLTQEEVQAALARVAGEPPALPAYFAPQNAVGPPQASPQPYYGQYPPYAWQPPQEPPRRDWRDWFIMATVMSGVSYGLYTLSKRYIYPLVAPPTPERLEQDKKSIDDQFERAFALVEQLAKDTEALKAAEKDRNERLDTALTELETTISELKSANRRREDDAQRLRDDVNGLKDSLPRAMDAQRQATDSRLVEVNTELKSLKTLISQRMNAAPSLGSAGSNYLRPSSGNATPPVSSAPQVPGAGDENATSSQKPAEDAASDYVSSLGGRSPFGGGSGMPASSRASIPSWQKAMQTQSQASTNGDASSSSKTEAGSSS